MATQCSFNPCSRFADMIMLNDNRLAGPIPTEIGHLDRLRSLRFECNDLSGTIPTEIMNMTSLEDLTIHDNFLHGPIPAQVETMKYLGKDVIGERCELHRVRGPHTFLRSLPQRRSTFATTR